MTIAEAAERGKRALTGALSGAGGVVGGISRDWLIVAIVLLASSASFGLGMLADREMKTAPAIEIQQLTQDAAAGLGEPAAAEAASLPTNGAGKPVPAAKAATASSSIPAGGQVVASKTGTKYYLPWCGTVSRIKDENKVWFASAAAAQAAGYQPAANCKGL